LFELDKKKPKGQSSLEQQQPPTSSNSSATRNSQPVCYMKTPDIIWNLPAIRDISDSLPYLCFLQQSMEYSVGLSVLCLDCNIRQNGSVGELFPTPGGGCAQWQRVMVMQCVWCDGARGDEALE